MLILPEAAARGCILPTAKGEYFLDAAGKVGTPYFSAILRDVLNRTRYGDVFAAYAGGRENRCPAQKTADTQREEERWNTQE